MPEPWVINIVGHDIKPASWFLANAKNVRIHPRAQSDATEGCLNELGWVKSVTVNKRTAESWPLGDRGVETLRRMNPSPNRPLVDAAELYVVTARELLRRMAASKRSRVELAASTNALRALVHDTGRRSGAWIGEMLRANERLDKAYFNYRVTGEALASLFDSLRRARANLAARVDPALLLDEPLRANAEARALAAAKRASEELGEVRRLASRN